jgi:hypothetical protein
MLTTLYAATVFLSAFFLNLPSDDGMPTNLNKAHPDKLRAKLAKKKAAK